MAKRRKKRKRKKKKIEDIKRRDPNALRAILHSGSGKHKDRKKEANKKKARQKVDKDHGEEK